MKKTQSFCRNCTNIFLKKEMVKVDVPKRNNQYYCRPCYKYKKERGHFLRLGEEGEIIKLKKTEQKKLW